MPSKRIRRVNEAVREVLSSALVAGLKDPRIGFVTVTGVETSPDLRNASVYLSVLGNDEEREETFAGLEDSRKLLQSKIAHELQMKNTPVLQFVYDESVDRGMRMSALIDQAAAELPDETESEEDE